jgi:hypothetical protein
LAKIPLRFEQLGPDAATLFEALRAQPERGVVFEEALPPATSTRSCPRWSNACSTRALDDDRAAGGRRALSPGQPSLREDPQYVTVRIRYSELAARPVVRHQHRDIVRPEPLVESRLVGHEQRQPGTGLALALFAQVDLFAISSDDGEVGGLTERVIKLEPTTPV